MAERPDTPVQLMITFLYYRDLARAEAFYRDVLGLPLVIDQGFAKLTWSITDSDVLTGTFLSDPLDLDGRFVDVRLLNHNEPIFVSGLGQAPFDPRQALVGFERLGAAVVAQGGAPVSAVLRAAGRRRLRRHAHRRVQARQPPQAHQHR